MKADSAELLNYALIASFVLGADSRGTEPISCVNECIRRTRVQQFEWWGHLITLEYDSLPRDGSNAVKIILAGSTEPSRSSFSLHLSAFDKCAAINVSWQRRPSITLTFYKSVCNNSRDFRMWHLFRQEKIYWWKQGGLSSPSEHCCC